MKNRYYIPWILLFPDLELFFFILDVSGLSCRKRGSCHFILMKLRYAFNGNTCPFLLVSTDSLTVGVLNHVGSVVLLFSLFF